MSTYEKINTWRHGALLALMRSGLPRRFREMFRSLRFQLLAAVNVVMIVGLGLVLAFDYQREVNDRLREKQTALTHQARLLAPGIQRTAAVGPPAIQRYIDEVCAHMHESDAPGHHITVRLIPEGAVAAANDAGHFQAVVLQARAHLVEPEVTRRLQEAASAGQHNITLRGEPFIFGTFRDQFAGDLATGGIGPGRRLDIYITESVAKVLHEVRGHLYWRLGALAVLGIVAMGVIDLILIRLVSRPLGRLVHYVRRIRSGHLGERAIEFRTSELRYVSEDIASMSAALAENERRRRIEMDKGRSIQRNLLPQQCQVAGAEFAVHFEPAAAVGGDYFDVIELPNGDSLWCIADVTGHGVPAAMSASMLKILLLSAAPNINADTRLEDVLSFVNMRFLAVTLPEDFASMVLLRWRPAEGRLEYASAGHETAFLISRTGDRCRPLPSTGPLLGVLEGAQWTSSSLSIGASPRADRLYLFTDGAAETMDPRGRFFGREQMASLVCSVSSVPLRCALETVAQVLAQHRGDQSPADDLTLVAVDLAPDAALIDRKSTASVTVAQLGADAEHAPICSISQRSMP